MFGPAMTEHTYSTPAPSTARSHTLNVGPFWATIGRAHERRTWVEAYAPPRSYGRWVLAGIRGYYVTVGMDR